MYSLLILLSRTIVGLVGNANSGPGGVLRPTISDCSDHHNGNFSDNCDHGGKLKTPLWIKCIYDEGGLLSFEIEFTCARV